MNDKRHEIFISYSSKDSNIANHLVNLLECKGIKCWIAPRDIPEGATWDDQIPEAIHSSRIFIVLISNNSINSKEVPKEIRIAVKYCEAIYPIRIDNVMLKGSFEYHLSGCQWTDLTYEQHDKLEKFSNTLKQYLQDNVPISKPTNNHRTKSIKLRYATIAIITILIVAGLIFSFINTHNKIQTENDNTTETTAAIIFTDDIENTNYIGNDLISTEDTTSGKEKLPLNVPGLIPSQQFNTDDLYSNLSQKYIQMESSETQPVDMTKYLTNLVNTDIDNDGINDEFLFTIREDTGLIDIKLSSGNTISWNITDFFDDRFPFSSADSFTPIDISAVDINKDGICEVLFKQFMPSNRSAWAAGLIYSYSDGVWSSVTLDDHSDDTTMMVDIELVEDGIIVLLNKGVKVGPSGNNIGPFEYFNFMGQKYVIYESHPLLVEESKALAKEYWPFENWFLDSGNYTDQDFTVTDEAIDKLKEELGIPSDAHVTTTVSGVLYYEGRNIYLKQVLFKGDGIGETYVYIDKHFNQIDFNPW